MMVMELIKILAFIALGIIAIDVYLYIGVMVYAEKTMVDKHDDIFRFGYTITMLFWPFVILYLLWLQNFVGYRAFVDSIKVGMNDKVSVFSKDSADEIDEKLRPLTTLNEEQERALRYLLGSIGVNLSDDKEE